MTNFYRNTVFAFDDKLKSLGLKEGVTSIQNIGAMNDVLDKLTRPADGIEGICALDYAHGASLGQINGVLIDEPFLFVVGDKEIDKRKSTTALKLIPLEMIVGRSTVRQDKKVDPKYSDFVLIRTGEIDWSRSNDRYDPFGRESGGRVLIPSNLVLVEREGIVVYSVDASFDSEIGNGFEADKIVMLARQYNVLITPKGGIFGPYTHSQELRKRFLTSDRETLLHFGVGIEKKVWNPLVEIKSILPEIMLDIKKNSS